MESAEPGDILIIDNGGRMDEACIGDLIALEARASGLAGILVWGCHRDTAELIEIGLPIFSLGAYSAGPARLDPRESNALVSARFGEIEVDREDTVFADDDGILFVAESRLGEVLATARNIWERERKQATELRSGRTLRQQLRFQEYLSKRDLDPNYTFRQHLRRLGGTIEE